MKNVTLEFLRDGQGATAVEYSMAVGLIVAMITVIMGKLGTQLNTVFISVCTVIKDGIVC